MSDSTLVNMDVGKAEAEVIQPDFTAVHKVFSQELLLEIILDYAVRTNTGAVARSTLRSLRLVQKGWLKILTKVLRKSREPLFQLVLSPSNSSSSSELVQKHGKILDNFLKFLTATTRVTSSGPVPTFSLKIGPSFLRSENYETFYNCLVNFGGGLVGINLFVIMHGTAVLAPKLPSTLSLPLLTKFTVNLVEKSAADNPQIAAGAPPASVPRQISVTNLISYLLTSGPELKAFILPFSRRFPCPHVPSGFESITFPTTLTKLQLSCHTRTEDLQVLIRNELPNLKSLTLQIPEHVPPEDRLLFRILDKIRTTLCTLELFGTQYGGPPRVITELEFPVMEKLKLFSINAIQCELENPCNSPLEKMLPKLEALQLCHQTADVFWKWTDNSQFETVKDLSLHLVCPDFPHAEDDDDYVLDLDLEAMVRVHRTFPNVVKLCLVLSASLTCGIRYTLREMRQLTSLRITVVGCPPELVSSDVWDSLFIGLPVKVVEALRESPECWNVMEIKNGDLPTIRMMEELTTLILEANCACEPGDHPVSEQALTSDLSFHFAFLKMPKLRHLYLQGRFMVSDDMAAVWRSRGNTLVYTPMK